MWNYPINVTLDTNIFFANNYDFSENSTLKLLIKYVRDKKIKVVLSDIVIREAKNQIIKQASNICGITRNLRSDAIKKSTEYFINYIGLGRILEIPDKNNAKEKSIELLENYIIDINAEILDLNLINLNSVIDDYFIINPPFQDGEKKRKEFPDAFIASQIKNRFGDNEPVVIITKDNGFKSACGETSNHIFLESLGQLYNEINKQERAYQETIDIITEVNNTICDKVNKYIVKNNNLSVFGTSVDKDGKIYGHDYSEVIINEINNTSLLINSVDDLREDVSIVTLWIKTNININCYYNKYSDSSLYNDNREHTYIETVNIKEYHHSKFVCRIKLYKNTKEIEIMPFNVILGGDTRISREVITPDYYNELHNDERENLGFVPLERYNDYLEMGFDESKMKEEIIYRFEQLNKIYRQYEEYSIIYESLKEKLDDSLCDKKFIDNLIKQCKFLLDFPNLHNCYNSKLQMNEILKLIEMKNEIASEISEKKLPDVLNFADNIIIDGLDKSKLVL